jgi:hypothetical protein
MKTTPYRCGFLFYRIFIVKEKNMSKIIKLTEADLARIVRQVINESKITESEINEGIFSSLKNLFKSAEKPLSGRARTAVERINSLPLMSQIPTETRFLIQKLPQNTKIGPKFASMLKSHGFGIQGVQGWSARGANEYRSLHPNLLNGANIYASKLSKMVNAAKQGGQINPKELFTNATFLKQELENARTLLPPVPKKGIIKNSKNLQLEKDLKSIDQQLYYNTAQVNKFISDFQSMLKRK